MILIGEMAFILRYFMEFVYDDFVKQLLVLPQFQNILLIVYDHINTRGVDPLPKLGVFKCVRLPDTQSQKRHHNVTSKMTSPALNKID